MELREEIDKMNLWLFDNINNAVYRSSFSRSNEGHFDGVNTFFADFAVPPADAREELRERKTASAPAHTTIWHFRRLTGMHSGRFRPSAPASPRTRPIRSILETTADSTSTRPGTIWAQNLRKKRRKKRRRPADAAAADQIIDKK